MLFQRTAVDSGEKHVTNTLNGEFKLQAGGQVFSQLLEMPAGLANLNLASSILAVITDIDECRSFRRYSFTILNGTGFQRVRLTDS